MLSLSFVYVFASEVQEKKPMTWDDVVSWKRISSKDISADGKWVLCRMEPWKGDASVLLFSDKGKQVKTFSPAGTADFSYSSSEIYVTMLPYADTVARLKKAGTDKKKMPVNSLLIYDLKTGSSETIDSIASYRVCPDADIMAYQKGSAKVKDLYIRLAGKSGEVSFPAVSDFGFSEKGGLLYFVSDSLLYVYSPNGGRKTISDKKGTYAHVVFSGDGSRLAYLFSADKKNAGKNTSVYISDGGNPAVEVVKPSESVFPEGFFVSMNGSLSFSEDGQRLYFGTAPASRERDPSVLPEDFPGVQIWKWDEKVQYTQQIYDKSRELKRTYRAVYNIASGKTVQLADMELPSVKIACEGNGPAAILYTTAPYDTESMWTGRKRYDIYSVNLDTGERRLIKMDSRNNYSFSPGGKYLYWYSDADSSWFSRCWQTGEEFRLTRPDTFAAWDEENDVPDYPGAYGCEGWTEDDRYILLKDRYDIFRFSPDNSEKPLNLTVNGRKERISYSLANPEEDKDYVILGKKNILSSFYEDSKNILYAFSKLDGKKAPEPAVSGDYKYSGMLKAEKADKVIFTRENFEVYPDVYLSGTDFRNPVRLTDGISQQEEFIWGSGEIVRWTSLDGVELEGMLFKPENYDPSRKYPMIVNFYERYSNTLRNYRMPEPGRSTIDYHLYLSNGYIVFNPDIRYVDGYPGESCYNCIMPGIMMLIDEGIADKNAIGAQGHSWGGYQTAYLSTKTDLFAAIESGAPVVNMFSAYGGIRWGSGKNRSMQYEHGQSRIGANIWEEPLLYMENSPLLEMNKVTTPVLIMHNDQDGHVPWYQGIEFFIALKRLQKPAWMLNYTGEPHWPMRLANRVDFQKRMFQFFNHYLKGEPMPVWMSEGVPAVDSDFDLGY